jgi:hypothetical protein
MNAKGNPIVLLLGGNQSQGTSLFEFFSPPSAATPSAVDGKSE